MARAAAARLGLANVRYEVDDARHFRGGDIYDAAYMLDIIHHIPPETREAAARAAGQGAARGRPAPRQGRGQPPRMEALVHPRARFRHGSAHAGALLAREQLGRPPRRTSASASTVTSWWTSSRTPTCSTSPNACRDLDPAPRRGDDRRLRQDAHSPRGEPHHRAGRAGGGDRSQRRRQVHRLQGDRGLPQAHPGPGALRRRRHHRPAARSGAPPGPGLCPPGAHRVPADDGSRESRDGGLYRARPGPDPRGAGARLRALPHPGRAAAVRRRAPCRAASSRWWRSAGRS